MSFEVRLPAKPVWCLRAAGIEPGPYLELAHKLLTSKARLPATISSKYFLADPPCPVTLTVLSDNPIAHVRVQLTSPAYAKRVQAALDRYSLEKDGAAVLDREERELDSRIAQILKADDVTADALERGKVTFARRTLQALMQLCKEINHARRFNVLWQFVQGKIAKEDRVFLARWLVGRYALERDPTTQDDIDTVFANHKELAVREIADDLIRFVKDRTHINRPGPCEVLAATKDPRAPEVIASVLGDEDVLTRVGIECLARLKARQYVGLIKPFLRHRDPDIRRAVSRALKKLGSPVEAPPPPVHLVKKASSIPSGLEEWSANLDFADLEPRLKKLSACVQQGFGGPEIAEVMGVADEMKPDQTKAFRFPIRWKNGAGELWLVIFMDDIDSPDLEVHAPSEIIRQLLAKF